MQIYLSIILLPFLFLFIFFGLIHMISLLHCFIENNPNSLHISTRYRRQLEKYKLRRGIRSSSHQFSSQLSRPDSQFYMPSFQWPVQVVSSSTHCLRYFLLFFVPRRPLYRNPAVWALMRSLTVNRKTTVCSLPMSWREPDLVMLKTTINQDLGSWNGHNYWVTTRQEWIFEVLTMAHVPHRSFGIYRLSPQTGPWDKA
jgi:hypothetical protein